MKNELIILGSGGHAQSCIDVIEDNKKFTIVGLLGEKKELKKKIFGYEIIGSSSDLEYYKKQGIKYIIIGLGLIGNNKKRIAIIKNLLKLKFKIPQIISPNAYISKHAKLGNSVQIFNKVFINAGASIGDYCIINSGSIIEHGVQIDNNSHISTNVIINGNVTIKKNVFIGSSSVIRENLTISKKFIKMGSVIKKNL
jgi:sugar O-acyltransferase (sialic acid O-acetyltransferase NeuD family)